MQRVILLTTIIFLSLNMILNGMIRTRSEYNHNWLTHVERCRDIQACWLQINPSQDNAERAIEKLNEATQLVSVDIANSGRNAQWTHQQGYQGQMLFNQNSVAFLSILVPANVSDQNRIHLGDVVLVYGVPDFLQRLANGSTRLYYTEQSIIFRIDTREHYNLSPHQTVISITLPSAFCNQFNFEQNSSSMMAWTGFTSLPHMPSETVAGGNC